MKVSLVLFLTSGLALAAGPRKPAAVIGSAKEDEPCPAVAVAPIAGEDLALLRGLQFAFEPAPAEIRSQAIEDLGLLGDPRALNALAVLTLDANPALAKAAVRAVALFHHPRAEEILSNLVRHSQVPLSTRQQALALVPFQNTVTAVRFVHFVARDRAVPAAVAEQARRLAIVLSGSPGAPTR